MSTSSYSPLYDPAEQHAVIPGGLDGEVRLARQILDQEAGANIHDHTAMLRAAVRLDHRLRAILAAIDAQRGEGQ